MTTEDEAPDLANDSQSLVVQPGYCMDTKKLAWSSYYNYVGHTEKNNVIWHCKKCTVKISVSNSSKSNATRHYLTVHKLDIKIHKPKIEKPVTTFFEINPVLKAKRESTQAKFNASLLKLITIQGLPFDIVSKPEFRNLVQIANSNISVLSKTTYVTYMNKYVESKIVPFISDLLKKSDMLVLSLDIWTSRRGHSILGIRCHLFDLNWNLVSRCIGFEQLSERHTGDNIKSLFVECLKKYDIAKEKVRFVVTDNGSNMIKAFQMTEVFQDEILGSEFGFGGEADSNIDQEEEAEEQIWQNFLDELLEHDSEDSMEVLSTFGEDIELQGLTRLSCIAHTLQLVVNKAIQSDTRAKSIAVYTQKLAAFFRLRAYWRDELRKSGARELLLPVKTRWNSILFSLQRLSEESVHLNVQTVIANINRTDKKSAKKLPKAPVFVRPSTIKSLLSLLKPIQVATDRLQTENISSSIAILTVLKAFKDINTVQTTEFSILKETLLTEIKSRFEDSVINNETYILATLLDPRVKASMFTGPMFLPRNSIVNIRLPSASYAKTILQIETNILAQQEPITSVSSQENVDSIDKIDENELFSIIPIQTASNFQNEVDSYLNEAVIHFKSNPLMFWKESSRKYPQLSKTAKLFLSIPATSGGVERTFSVAGSLTRPRRATMTPKNLKNVILYREFVSDVENLEETA